MTWGAVLASPGMLAAYIIAAGCLLTAAGALPIVAIKRRRAVRAERRAQWEAGICGFRWLHRETPCLCTQPKGHDERHQSGSAWVARGYEHTVRPWTTITEGV